MKKPKSHHTERFIPMGHTVEYITDTHFGISSKGLIYGFTAKKGDHSEM